MLNLRVFLGLILAAAIANYGVLATSTAHVHDHDGAHGLHVAVETSDTAHGHHHDHDASASDRRADHAGAVGDDAQADPALITDASDSLPVPDHTETGFHTHSAPQLGPQNVFALADLSPPAERIKAPSADDVRPQGGERPPFRPPRFFF